MGLSLVSVCSSASVDVIRVTEIHTTKTKKNSDLTLGLGGGGHPELPLYVDEWFGPSGYGRR